MSRSNKAITASEIQHSPPTHRPAFKQPFVLVPQFFGSLVFDRIGVRYLPFDKEATELLKSLADQSIHQFIAEAESDTEREQLTGFYFHLDSLGLFDSNGFANMDVIDHEPAEDFLSAPLVTHVEVIGACNITCTHCFAGTLPRNQNPLSLAELDRLFQELVSLGCFRVSLTGGEPLMRADILEVIDSAIDHGLAVAVTTNAMVIDEAMAEALGNRKSLRLTVSLDGATAESNDAVRGEGVFDEVCQRLAILRKHSQFSLGFTVTNDVASEVDQCVELARELGASAVVFRPLYPTGTALQNPDLMPTFEKYVKAINSVAGGTHLEEDISELESQCGAGELLASISVQGDVNPCSFLGNEFVSGNIRENSFREIWNQGHQFKRLRELGAQSHSSSEASQSCGSIFQGGCRCRSLTATGDVNGADPWHTEHQSNSETFFFPLKNLVANHEQ
ncbi:MAG: radical SAM/SPASM domain-containing protein [Mariniblastus sp.]